MLHVIHPAGGFSARRHRGALALGALGVAVALGAAPLEAQAQWCPPSTPVLCPGGSCAPSARACASIEGCPPTQPHRCSNGACAVSDAACSSAPPPVEPGSAPSPGAAPNVEPTASDVPPAGAPDVRVAVPADDDPAETAEAAAAADEAADDAERAADDAEVAADDAEVAADDAEVAADDARESLRAVQSSDEGCAAPTPVDCADGTCASSIYACDPIDRGEFVDRAATPDDTGTVDEPTDTDAALVEGPDGAEDSEACATSAPGAASAAGASAVALGFLALVASRLRRRPRQNQSPSMRA